MPTDKDLIKDTIAVGGHYSNYSPGFIVGAQYWIVVAHYHYRVSWFDEAVIQIMYSDFHLPWYWCFLWIPWFYFILV